MNISTILSTEDRVKILEYLLFHQIGKVGIRRVASEVKLSPALIHKYVNILEKEGIATDGTLAETPNVRALRLLFNLKRIEDAKITHIARAKLNDIEGIGVYGSWSDGTNNEKSDLDLWLKIRDEPSDSELSKLRNELEAKIGVPVDVTIATPERLKHFREKSDSFFYSLHHGKVLWGKSL